MRKKNVYIVLMHTMSLKPGTTDQWEGIEKCEFVDALKNRHDTCATVILDFTNKTVVKDRTNEYDYDNFFQYVKKTYPEQITELEAELKAKENDQ